MKSATTNQKKLIENMERLLDIQFVGETISDASNFISKHMTKYKEAQAFVYEMTYNADAY